MRPGELRGVVEAAFDLLMCGRIVAWLARMGKLRVDHYLAYRFEEPWLFDRQGSQERINYALLGQKARILWRVDRNRGDGEFLMTW